MAFVVAIVLTLIAALPSKSAAGCFESIISFGDSVTDTGNYPLLRAAYNQPQPRYVSPPYGRTYFHRPTGRCCDGRLVIDFLAQGLGLPLEQPYIAGVEGAGAAVNFAVIGSKALDNDYYRKIGIINPYTNVSLGIQLDWFKQYLAAIPDGRRYLEKSLVVMGEIGGNDYNHPIMQHAPGFLQFVQSMVPPVVDYVGSVVEELIKLGAETILVPGNLPIGCHPIYLAEFESISSAKDYDPKTGCLNWLNDLALHHNELLQRELARIRRLHPHARLIYADYYNAEMRFYLAPEKFGFSEGEVLKSCCGWGGTYNFNEDAMCGIPPSTPCDDPAKYANWDGHHLTEAANRLIAQALLHGPYTTPHISTLCPSLPLPLPLPLPSPSPTRKTTTAIQYS